MQIDEIREEFFTQVQNRDAINKRVWGFPLNTTFVSLDECWRLVQNTKIDAVNRQDVEFGLSVFI
jgi:hypothetical protein